MRRRRTALIALIALCLTSTLALAEFRRIPLAGQQHILDAPDEFPEPVAIGELIDTLQARSIHHAWVVDAGLRWILLYRSGLSLTTVLAVSPERYAPFTERVVRAREQGLPTAVVGYAHQWRRILQADSAAGAGDAARGTFIRDQLFFVPDPSDALLAELLFAPARQGRPRGDGRGPFDPSSVRRACRTAQDLLYRSGLSCTTVLLTTSEYKRSGATSRPPGHTSVPLSGSTATRANSSGSSVHRLNTPRPARSDRSASPSTPFSNRIHTLKFERASTSTTS
jgi:hypothetical protein